MDPIKVAIAGFGNVGRSFARYVIQNPEVRIVAISDSTGGRAIESYDHLTRLLRAKEDREPISRTVLGGAEGISTNQSEDSGLCDFIVRAKEQGASVIVEALPTNIRTGQPGLDLIRSALSKGLNVVTVDKGPMVRGFDELIQTAARTGTRLAYTGTIGVGIPDQVAGSEVLEIRGVLNGTTNYILTEMQSGATYQDALARAQADGIAEPDPSLDVEGWDTACKILILAKTVMDSKTGAGVTVEDVVRTGIGAETESLIQVGRDTERVVRVVGRARIWQGRLRLSVTPKLVGPESPFYSVAGNSKAAVFRTREHGEVTAEAHSGRQSISDVIFKDILKVSE